MDQRRNRVQLAAAPPPDDLLTVDYLLIENPDGSKTCRVSDVDQMYGTKGEASFTLYPGKAYIEIKGQLYNRTSTPQTFLWWAKPGCPGQRSHTVDLPAGCPCCDGSWKT